MHILLVEDHRDLAANVGDFLEAAGHVVDYAPDGLTGLHLAVTHRYDALVLDVGLPSIDGLTLCKRLREDARSTIPILMLTANNTEHDKLSGFEAGADDCLVKPFSFAELHARLKALVRRASAAAEVLQVADLTFDVRTLIVQRGGRRMDLTPAGLKLLQELMRVSPGVLSRQEAARAIWGENPPDSDSALRGHIHALRQALDHGFELALLHTVHGLGYRLVADRASNTGPKAAS